MVDDTEPVISTLILSPIDSLVFPAVTFQDAFTQVLCVMAVSGNYVGLILSWKSGKYLL